jgi:8-oxo-dGTP pyrophosphatase MutT (NUDIX family)
MIRQYEDIIRSYSPFSFSSPYQKASVAILMRKESNENFIVFTKRSDNMREHAGEISFPGGRIEEQDFTLYDTAVRETEEEIGVKLYEKEYIGRIDDSLTTSKYHIYPFVFSTERELHYHKSLEISELIEVPLSHLLKAENCKLEKVLYQNEMRELYSYTYEDYIIWGATGYILNNFLSLLQSS